MKHSIRNWHTWVSVALGIPLILVGLTTVFIAHEKALGTKEVIVPTGGVLKQEENDVRAVLPVSDGLWLGTRHGVYTQAGDATPQPLAGSPQDEIRGFSPAENAVLMAGKMGLWRYENGSSTQVYAGDCWHVVAATNGWLASCKDAGLLHSADGRTFAATPLQLPKVAQASSGVPLSKIIMDIHTGKLFFGKSGEWIWIDILGLAMVGLGLTGLVMWMRARRQRAQAVQGQQVPDAAAAPSP